MPQRSQKKSEQILVMVVPEMFAEIQAIAKTEDRPLGYVARELMIRGMALYRQDGRVREASVPKGYMAIDDTVRLPDQSNGKVVGQIFPPKEKEKEPTKDDVRGMYARESRSEKPIRNRKTG